MTPIVDIKVSGGRKIIVTAGGINHQRRPSTYGGNHPVALVSRGVAPLYKDQPVVEREVVAEIGGPLCTERDWLAREVYLESAAIGDLVVIGLSGAYGASAAPDKFLGFAPAAQVYMCDGEPYRPTVRRTTAPSLPAPVLAELEPFLVERVAPVADRLDIDVALMREIVSETASRGLMDFQLMAKSDVGERTAFVGAYCHHVATYSAALAFALKQVGAAYRVLERHSSGRPEIEILLGELRRGTRTAGIGFSCGHAPCGIEPIQGVREDQAVVLRGPLRWVTGHEVFDLFLVDFMLDGEAHIAPIPFASIPEDKAGMTISPMMSLIGLSSTGTVSARFDGWRVPADLVIGPYDAVTDALSPVPLLNNCYLMLGSCDGMMRYLGAQFAAVKVVPMRATLLERLDEWSTESARLRSELVTPEAGGFEWALRKKIEIAHFAQRCIEFACGAIGAPTAQTGHPIRRFQAEVAVLALAGNHPNARPLNLDFHRFRA